MTAADTVERRGEAGPARLAFDLPPELEAARAARGAGPDPRRRADAGRPPSHRHVEHSTFALLPAFLEPATSSS